jgi:hypothetical protein
VLHPGRGLPDDLAGDQLGAKVLVRLIEKLLGGEQATIRSGFHR